MYNILSYNGNCIVGYYTVLSNTTCIYNYKNILKGIILINKNTFNMLLITNYFITINIISNL